MSFNEEYYKKKYLKYKIKYEQIKSQNGGAYRKNLVFKKPCGCKSTICKHTKKN